LTVPIPTPFPLATEMPALRGSALALMPTEPVILMPPVASMEKLVRSMAGQTSMSIDQLKQYAVEAYRFLFIFRSQLSNVVRLSVPFSIVFWNIWTWVHPCLVFSSLS